MASFNSWVVKSSEKTLKLYKAKSWLGNLLRIAVGRLVGEIRCGGSFGLVVQLI